MSKGNHLQPVPDRSESDTIASVDKRTTTTSFRIPVQLFNKVRDEAIRNDTSISRIYMEALTQYFATFNERAWETDGDHDDYNPSHFYTHSQDKKGHSVTIYTSITKPLAAELANLAQSGMVPAYRSRQDIIRDAIYHRVKQIAIMINNSELEITVDMAMLMSDEMRIVDEAQQAEQLIQALRLNAQAIYAKDGNEIGRLRRYLAQRREMADSIPEPYRDDYLSAITDYERRIDKKKSSPKRRK